MHVTKWVYEGTVEELRQIPELWRSGEAIEIGGIEGMDDLADGLSQHIIDFVGRLSGSDQRTKLMLAYLNRQVELGKVTMEIGKSTKSETGENRYLLIYKRGPRNVGAVVILRPANAKLSFRLGAKDVEDHDGDAVARDVTGPYRVELFLDSPDAVVEAHELTRLAVEKALLSE
jgi:hypothetical protein